MKKVRLFSENSANFSIIYLNGILKFFQFQKAFVIAAVQIKLAADEGRKGG
ncbi:hypothetical protein ACIQ1H_06970 [Lysinibacillus sp. NPDC097279]|uniref:hypothetical protein n=1 Tax=Lysinibacillus sp. NPDC097279 TaxID=3364143 RepID=UPI00380468FB